MLVPTVIDVPYLATRLSTKCISVFEDMEQDEAADYCVLCQVIGKYEAQIQSAVV